MAADKDVVGLARRIRESGANDAQVVEGLTGMGFSKTEARAAVAQLNPTPAPSTTPQPPKPRRTSPAPSPKPQAGRTAGGTPPGPTSTPPGSPAGPASLPTIPTPDLSQVTLTPPRSLTGGDLGGFLAGLLAYTVALNFLRYGPGGVKGWLSAKLLNRPMDLVEAGKGAGGKNKHTGSTGTATTAAYTGLTSTRPAAPAAV